MNLRTVALVALACAGSFGSAKAATITGQVERIFPSSNGVMNFRLKSDTCNTATEYYTYTADTAHGKIWTALLIAAAVAGEPVSVSVPACGAGNKVISYLFQDF